MDSLLQVTIPALTSTVWVVRRLFHIVCVAKNNHAITDCFFLCAYMCTRVCVCVCVCVCICLCQCACSEYIHAWTWAIIIWYLSLLTHHSVRLIFRPRNQILAKLSDNISEKNEENQDGKSTSEKQCSKIEASMLVLGNALFYPSKVMWGVNTRHLYMCSSVILILLQWSGLLGRANYGITNSLESFLCLMKWMSQSCTCDW